MARADKFEILCDVRADLSSAPYQTRQGISGRTYYKRAYDMILLVGLTELKAQIAWIDSVTVCSQGTSLRSPFLISVAYGSRDWRKGSKYRSQKSRVSKAEFTFQERCRRCI
jgi:hypothetical protein